MRHQVAQKKPKSQRNAREENRKLRQAHLVSLLQTDTIVLLPSRQPPRWNHKWRASDVNVTN